MVFFTPADIFVPPNVQERLTRIAKVTETFFSRGMEQWGYPAAVTNIFQRTTNGMVEVLNVKGEQPVASGKYSKPNFAREVIASAARQYGIAEKGQVWWIFVCLGDPPANFGDFRGIGNPRDGGWAMVNYNTRPGEVRADLGLAEGFNGKIFMKGAIHELGHALGLPHTGPDISLGRGNSLMGPTTALYAARKYPTPEKIYLSESSAAMLWRHPIFSGNSMGDAKLPKIKLVDYKASFNQAEDMVTISGKLVSDQKAHSIVVIDDQGKEYWNRSYVARIGEDGRFQIRINQPAKADGYHQIVFCFDNGIVTGDGNHLVFQSHWEIRKAYTWRNDAFQFDN